MNDKLDKLEQLLNNKVVPASTMQMQMTERIVTERQTRMEVRVSEDQSEEYYNPAEGLIPEAQEEPLTVETKPVRTNW